MKIGAISLGCDKNRVDTEKMLARLQKAGHTVVSSEEEADVVVVNTCAFTADAKQEAIDEILSVAAVKERRPELGIVVTGCLPERYKGELTEGFPEVNAFLGIGDYDSIVRAVEAAGEGGKFFRVSGGDAYTRDRVLTTPPHYAYLKIAEGCSNRCTYCAIPGIRGAYRSEREEDLLAEAEDLAARGVRELILVAQDVTRYGLDTTGERRLIPLDIPLQHIDSGVLRRMNRHTDEAYTRALVKKVKDAGITMRTSFISGFPGESEEAHKLLAAFLAEAEIDFAGIFGYSREEGTPADRMKDHLPKSVIRSRTRELRGIEEGVILRKAAAMKGSRVEVVYEGIDYDRGCFVGRTERQAPDVDSVVRFRSSVPVDIGECYTVEITGNDGIDLLGERV